MKTTVLCHAREDAAAVREIYSITRNSKRRGSTHGWIDPRLLGK